MSQLGLHRPLAEEDYYVILRNNLCDTATRQLVTRQAQAQACSRMDVESAHVETEYDASNPEVMLQYYTRLYPFKFIFKWLNQEHGPSKRFTNREFAFTLAGDVYLRYNSFSSADELKKQVCKYNPSRFEIGAIYSAKPRDKKTLRAGAFTPQLRELVFDIDMTDYDSVRTCCSGKGICKRCWGFISAAVKVLDSGLRGTFGYKHLLWVYSGRRGIHCWVSDDEAMQLTDEQRKALMGWLEVIRGGKDTVKKVNLRSNLGLKNKSQPLAAFHPFVQDAFDVLRDEFNELILEDQDCFASSQGWQVLLQLLPDTEHRLHLQGEWEADPSRPSSEKWSDIGAAMKEMDKEERSRYRGALEEVVLQYTYPRLDSEVTKHRNHLLKAPFCIHPSTGRVCVPVDPSKVDEFDPERVPTVGQLLREIDAAGVAKSQETPSGTRVSS